MGWTIPAVTGKSRLAYNAPSSSEVTNKLRIKGFSPFRESLAKRIAAADEARSTQFSTFDSR
jgi:hypothetical protein